MQAIYGKSSQKMPLTSFQWGLAFDVFAIAAAATGMLPYAVAVTHKLVCTKVGHEARGRGIKANLGVVYDEVCKTSSVIIISYIYFPCVTGSETELGDSHWAWRDNPLPCRGLCPERGAFGHGRGHLSGWCAPAPSRGECCYYSPYVRFFALFAAGQLCTTQQPQE